MYGKNCQTKRHNSNVVASSLPVFKLSEMLLFMFFLSLTCLKLYQALGVLWISSDQEDQMGAKIESKTIPRASDCSEHPPLLNSPLKSSQQNTCQIFLPKKIPELKISNTQKSIDNHCYLKSGAPLGYKVTLA